MSDTKWISAKERLPERRGKYLVAQKSALIDDYYVCIMYFDESGRFGYYDSEYGDVYPDNVDYWTDMPPAPGEAM